MFGWEFPCGENDWTRVTLVEGEVVARGVAVVPTCSGHPLCWGHVWLDCSTGWTGLVGLERWLDWSNGCLGALLGLEHLLACGFGCLGALLGLECWMAWGLVALGHCLEWGVGWLGVVVALGRCLDWMLLCLLASLWALDGLGSCVCCWTCG